MFADISIRPAALVETTAYLEISIPIVAVQLKLETQTPHDSTHEQQHRLLPISDPEDSAEVSEEVRRGDYLDGSEARRKSG